MLKLTLAATALAALLVPAQAAVPGAGDLMFTSFNADEDGWSMVSLVDLTPSTTVYFSDNEYIAGAFNTGESYHQWNSGASTVAAGTVIRFSNIDNATTLAASVGTLSRATVAGSSNYGLSATADTVYAYLGASAAAPSTFLSAISNGGFSATEGPLAGTGMTAGVNAVLLNNSTDFAQYTGPRSGQSAFSGYLPLVANHANWQDLGDGAFETTVPNTTAFSVSAVPEPSGTLAAFAGLGLMGLLMGRRDKR